MDLSRCQLDPGYETESETQDAELCSRTQFSARMSGPSARLSGASRREHDVARMELRSAIGSLSARGLKVSARWAAELLCDSFADAVGDASGGAAGGAQDVPMAGGAQDVPPMGGVPREAPPPAAEEERLCLAKCHFDMNEYQRAAHALRGCSSPVPRFLRWCPLAPGRAAASTTLVLLTR